MRKRSVQEIIEVVDLKDPNRRETAGGAPITSSSNRQERIQKTLSTAEKKIADEKNKAKKAKPSIEQQKINLAKYQSRTDRIKANTRKQQAIDKAERQKENDANKARSSAEEGQAKVVKSRETLAKNIAGKKPSIQNGGSRNKKFKSN